MVVTDITTGASSTISTGAKAHSSRCSASSRRSPSQVQPASRLEHRTLPRFSISASRSSAWISRREAIGLLHTGHSTGHAEAALTRCSRHGAQKRWRHRTTTGSASVPLQMPHTKSRSSSARFTSSGLPIVVADLPALMLEIPAQQQRRRR